MRNYLVIGWNEIILVVFRHLLFNDLSLGRKVTWQLLRSSLLRDENSMEMNRRSGILPISHCPTIFTFDTQRIIYPCEMVDSSPDSAVLY